MFQIEIRWADFWLPLAGSGYFPSRDVAEWAVARWKQDNNCTGDPFRVTEVFPNPAKQTRKVSNHENS